jgi:hypothetical protein
MQSRVHKPRISERNAFRFSLVPIFVYFRKKISCIEATLYSTKWRKLFSCSMHYTPCEEANSVITLHAQLAAKLLLLLLLLRNVRLTIFTVGCGT